MKIGERFTRKAKYHPPVNAPSYTKRLTKIKPIC